MALDRLTKVTGPGISSDHNWVGNNATFTGVTTTGSSFNVGISTFHSTLAEVHNIKSTGIITATGGSFSGNVTAVDGTFSGNVSIAGTLTYEDVTNIDSVGIITARSGLVSPYADVDDFLDVGSNIKLGNAGVITATSFVGDGSGLIGVASTDNIITGTAATFNTYPVDINAGLTIAGVTTTTDDIIIGADNKKLKLGAGEELQLYQAGNHSVIQHNGAHYLQLRSNSFIIMDAAATKTIFVGDPNGQSSLYFNGSKKLNTLNGGVDITGNLQVDGLHCLGQINLDSDIDVDGHTNLDNVSIAGVTTFHNNVHLLDNDYARFGSSQDLSIFHDGTNNWFWSGGGHPTIHESSGSWTLRSVANQNYIIATENNSVDLYYSGNKKLETTNTGVTVTGTLAATAVTGDGSGLTGLNTDLVSDTSPQLGGNLDTNSFEISFDDNHSAIFGDSNDLKILHTGSESRIDFSATSHSLVIMGSGGSNYIDLQPRYGHSSVKAIANNTVELYYDNEKMFQTNQDGAEFFDSDNNCNVYFTCNGTRRGYIFAESTNGGKLSFYDNQNHPMLSATKNGAVDLYHDNSKKLETTSSGVTVTGAVTATSFSGDGSSLTGISAFVTGMIIIWSGAANAIPSGWVLCNGSNSTPDLRGRFIVGYHDGNGDYDVNDTGGAETVTLSTSQIPSHDHAFSGSGSSSHSHSFTVNNEYSQLFHPKQSMIARGENKSGTESYGTSSATVSLSISGTTNSAGSGGSHENRPPYYALCYIMKT